MKEAAGKHMKATVDATSTGWPTRRMGVTPCTSALNAGSFSTCSASGVAMYLYARTRSAAPWP
jgi:hypothetical protein